MSDLLNEADLAEIEELTDVHNESTGLSWLWALLFGPLYYWTNGFVGRGFVVLALNFILIGFIISPFLAYPAWRKRAYSKAVRLYHINKASRELCPKVGDGVIMRRFEFA